MPEPSCIKEEFVTEEESVTDDESDEEETARPAHQSVAAENLVVKDDPHAAWFASPDKEPEQENEEEPEADNGSDTEEADLEAWFAPLDEAEEVGGVADPESSSTAGAGVPQGENIKGETESARMGETDDANEYDPELLFRHL